MVHILDNIAWNRPNYSHCYNEEDSNAIFWYHFSGFKLENVAHITIIIMVN